MSAIEYQQNYNALLELPLVKDLLAKNRFLKKDNKTLLNSSVLLLRKIDELTNKLKKLKRKNVDLSGVTIKVEPGLERVDLTREKSAPHVNIEYAVLQETVVDSEPNIQMTIVVKTSQELDTVLQVDKVVEEEKVEEEEEELEVEVEVEVEEEEVEVEVEEEVEVEVEEEEVEVEEEELEVEEEVVVEEEEEVVEEELVEEEEEEEVEEVEEVVVEEVVVEEVVVEEEEDSVYEVQIKGKTYYVTNEVDSIIYVADESGDISEEVGIYKNGKPVFNKKV